MNKLNDVMKNYERGKARALHILAKSDKTEEEMRKKLIKNEYPVEVIDRVLLFLKEYGYINDLEYTKNYFSYKYQKKSIRQICYDLYKKGVSKEVIDEVCMEINPDQQSLIKEIIAKRLKTIENIQKSDIQKTQIFLIRKGFQSGDVRRIIQEFLYYQEDSNGN